MSRELREVRRIKKYRQVTHKKEIESLKKELMKTTDWKEVQKHLKKDKLFKYDKEDYVLKQVSTDQQTYEDREKEIECLNDELSGIEDWKRYFFVLMEQEGDIEIDEDYYNEMVEDIKEENNIRTE